MFAHSLLVGQKELIITYIITIIDKKVSRQAIMASSHLQHIFLLIISSNKIFTKLSKLMAAILKKIW